MSIAKQDARWPEAILGTIALWLFVLLIYLPVLLNRHRGEPWTSVALDASTFGVSIVIALPLFAVFRGTLGSRAGVKLAAQGVAVVIVSIIQTVFDFLWVGWVTAHLEDSWRSLPTDMSRGYDATFNYVCVFAVNLALFHLLFARRNGLSRERQLAEARSAAQQAQLAALRYQLNPHFLFNTLNAISAMIVTRRNEEAEQMTDKLSGFLRASLVSNPSDLVPLQDELAIIEDYLDIETIRFGERLTVEIDCSEAALAARVPHFILQPLVENAIKYGVSPSPEPVVLALRAEIRDGRLSVCVCDDGAYASDVVKAKGVGVGLENVRGRLATVYGIQGRLEVRRLNPGFEVTISMPALEVAQPQGAWTPYQLT